MAEKLLTKNQLEKLIRDGDASIRFVQKKLTSKSSEWWQHFHLIHVNNQQQQYVSCNFCKKLLIFTSTNGTNNLRSHFGSCPERKCDQSPIHQQTIKEFYGSGKRSSVPKRVKKNIVQTCVEFCALDGRAFDLISGDGFRKLAKVLFDAGVSIQKSSIEVDDLLPHPTTVTHRFETRSFECALDSRLF